MFIKIILLAIIFTTTTLTSAYSFAESVYRKYIPCECYGYELNGECYGTEYCRKDEEGAEEPEIVSCEPLKDKIEIFLEESNHCTLDEDCKYIAIDCPFGCSTPLNIDTENTKLVHLINTYTQNCHKCQYRCPDVPWKPELACVNNKCTEVRR